eukprot:CAMPEP_0113507626 /NCGR_PEP_ID=MMETSP0014_2-20120614/36571_1 /TAXON_ID=2857 /ORGANISM="Nitzschia sp." /LENGTH=392 /DNA_ID=CAMNT_0000403259 /DNA_START=265 /DNA_END=1443 /DNA_ORIENTATION=+ /assembly_acc=CAM_ASM_000159
MDAKAAAAAFQIPSSSSSSVPTLRHQLPCSSPPPSSRSRSRLFLSDRTMDRRDAESSSSLATTVEATTATATDTQAFDFQSVQTSNNRKLFNGMVIGTVVVMALWALTHSQLEALIALWEYDLGPIDLDLKDELTKVSVAADLFMRLPLDALHSYEQLVPTNPVFYKACTSGVAYGLGDFVSQVLQGKDLEDIDLPRSMRSGAAGFIGHGPLCHYWLLFMETNLDFGGAWWATGIKVTADLTGWALFLIASYSFIIGMLELRDPRDVWKDVKATTWPALRSAWRFWPFVHTVSFSHAVPLDLKLLWVDVMEVVWVTILSKVANEDKDAARMVEDAEGELATDTAALAATEKGQPKTAEELLQTVLAACWPLIAMWPVLYAGYRLEVFMGLEV